MSKLTELRNLGEEMEKKLKNVKIFTAEELKIIGCKEAFIRLKLQYSNVCLVHLYTLYGAINDMDYNNLPQDVKAELKSFSDELK